MKRENEAHTCHSPFVSICSTRKQHLSKTAFQRWKPQWSLNPCVRVCCLQTNPKCGYSLHILDVLFENINSDYCSEAKKKNENSSMLCVCVFGFIFMEEKMSSLTIGFVSLETTEVKKCASYVSSVQSSENNATHERKCLHREWQILSNFWNSLDRNEFTNIFWVRLKLMTKRQLDTPFMT